ncbi:MAG: hypothetical protein P8N56_01000 [Schleiferiaceae bacterium]|nr:hypothetical protein [Schleiferiaceae bacterium]
MDGLLGRRLNSNRIVWISMGLFFGHQALIQSGYSLSGLDSYLDPLLFLPIALGCSAWLVRGIAPGFQWDRRFVIGFWLLSSAAFEAWIPSFDGRFTSDPWDVLAYALGGLGYSIFAEQADDLS